MISQCFKFKVYTVSLFGRIKNCIRFTSKILTIIDTYLFMKFQVELEIFKINFKIVFCVKHFISSELQPSVTN